MSNIISGHFQTQENIAFAIGELERIGFPRSGISAFYVNPAGQHDLYPIGGDEDKSEGAKETGHGAVVGASAGGVVGAALGAATLPLTGAAGPVVGALVGGYVGSLFGSLNSTKEIDEPDIAGESCHALRKAGMMVAVATATAEQEDEAVELLHSIHAEGIERSVGTIVDGDWSDFNPLSVPQLVTSVGPAA
jgi:phage tail tape-measure protein